MIRELQVPAAPAGSQASQGGVSTQVRSGPAGRPEPGPTLKVLSLTKPTANCRLTCGRVHLSWISDAYIDEHCRRCSVDTPERHFVVSTDAQHRTGPEGFGCHAIRFCADPR